MPDARPRHVPQRRCVACRSTRPQRELVRLVRSAEGGVQLDERGRAPGRGAYLCGDPACWRLALSGDSLTRALRAALTATDRTALEAYAGALESATADAPEAGAVAGGGGR